MANTYLENHKSNKLLHKFATRIRVSELTEAVERGLLDSDEVERAIKSGKLESVKCPVSFSPEKKIYMAQMLENVSDKLAYMEATNPMALGAYRRHALDITNVVTANTISPELFGVYPLEGRNGIIRYFNFNYGRDKGQVKAGDSFNSSINLPMNDPNYVTDLVDAEEILPKGTPATATPIRLKWPGIRLNTFSIAMGSVIGVSDNFGQITINDGSNTLGGTVVPSGVLTLDPAVFDGTDAVTVTYRYNNEFVRDDGTHFYPESAGFTNIPTANVEMPAIPVFAEVIAMNATWSKMAEYDMMKETKMSLKDILQSQIVGELERSIDNRNIQAVHGAADASNPITWSETPGVGVSQDAHYNGLRIELTKASKRIRQATGKYSANYVVAGTQASADIECINGFKSANTQQVPGSRLVGETASGIKLYETTALDEYNLFLGYKASNTLDNGAFYCPYLTGVSLGMIESGDMRAREGWASSFAFAVVNSKLYQRGVITPA